MKVGITLPQFRDDAEAAVQVALDAEAAGLDGVFVFDHLWPIGQPGRPALHSLPLAGALVAETDRVTVGTLVSRVGLFPDAVLVSALASAARMAGPHRFVAGLGTGDRLSRGENEAFGVPFDPAADRLASLDRCARMCRERGVTTWVGGRSRATRDVAAASADALNLWGASADEVAAERDVDVTWGGIVRPEDDAGVLLAGLAAAGATWAVCAPAGFEWPDAVARIASAAERVPR